MIGEELYELCHSSYMHHMHHSIKHDDAHSSFAEMMHLEHYLQMNLARIRKAKGLSQRDLAELVGVDQATVQRAEKMAPSAKLDTYRRCADALGVTLAAIFSEDRTPVEDALLQTLRDLPEEKQERVRKMIELFLAEH